MVVPSIPFVPRAPPAGAAPAAPLPFVPDAGRGAAQLASAARPRARGLRAACQL